MIHFSPQTSLVMGKKTNDVPQESLKKEHHEHPPIVTPSKSPQLTLPGWSLKLRPEESKAILEATSSHPEPIQQFMTHFTKSREKDAFHNLTIFMPKKVLELSQFMQVLLTPVLGSRFSIPLLIFADPVSLFP